MSNATGFQLSQSRLRTGVVAAVALSACLCGLDTPPSATLQTVDGLNSILWMRQAVEYEGVCRTVFQCAALVLDGAIRHTGVDAPSVPNIDDESRRLPLAVILDVDETVLVNTRFMGRMLKSNQDFSPTEWAEWTQQQSTELVPGAAEFVQHAHAMGVRVFFVTNRDASQEADTRVSLAALGIPLSTEPDVVLCSGEMGWGSDKTSRREWIADRHTIVLVIGDDLNDFVNANDLDAQGRAEVAAQNSSRWGRDWIIVPNPLYGSWKRSLLRTLPPDDGARRLEHEKQLVDSEY